MYEKFSTYTLDGKPFKLLFSLAAMAQIVERYESVENMANIVDKSQAEAVRVVPWLFTVLANQGAYYDNGGKAELISEEWVGARIMPSDLGDVMAACQLALARGMGMEHKPDDDGEVDIVLEEIRSKNVEGAEA